MSILNERAILVALNLAKFSPRKTDRRLTDEAVSRAHAAAGTLRVAKRLLPEHAIEPLTKLHTEIRDFHYKHTVAWSDQNERLLPSAAFIAYTDEMRGFEGRHTGLVRDFLDRYTLFIDEARRLLNGAFEASDYPSRHVIEGKFGFKLDFKPVPDAGDFRVSIMREAMDELRAGVQRRVAEAEHSVRAEVAGRLAAPLVAMVNRLAEPDAVFRDSLIGNVREMCDLLPALNVTGDPKIDELCRRVRTDLYHADADMLRANPLIRERTATKAQAILDTMHAYFGPAPEAVAA